MTSHSHKTYFIHKKINKQDIKELCKIQKQFNDDIGYNFNAKIKLYYRKFNKKEKT